MLAGKLCDYLLHRRGTGAELVILAELKSRAMKTSEVRDQLQGGADLVADMAIDVRAVVVHRGIDSMELRLLSRASIKHRGRTLPLLQRRSPFDGARA